MMDEKSRSTVKQLAFCHLLFSNDQTISQTLNVQFEFTKVINRTEGLASNDPVTYSGIWIPTVTNDLIDDRLIYEKLGDHLRYLSSEQILSIDFSETQFFIKNSQEPIARAGEIFFHNVLFSTVCIELFALIFLLFKLVLLPLLRCFLVKRKNDENEISTKF